MNVHGNNVIDIDGLSASGLRVAEQGVQLKETGGSHQFQDIVFAHLQMMATAAVQILHNHLKDVITDIVDLNSRC